MNVGYQGLMLAFPLITVPLVSRALGAQNIGIYSYTYSIANMFMLAGMLGISNYGNRSVARVRDDEVALSREFSSTYALQVAVSLVAVGAYVLYLVLFPQQYGQVAWIQLIQVLSVCFDVSWLFFGLEKFFLTIVRNLIVKVLSLLLIAVFVKGPDDLWAYTLIMACSTLMSQLYLFCSVPRYVKPVRPELRGSARRLRDIAVLFLPVAAYSVYRVLDKTMLGSLSTVTELGYFENAEKLINIPIAVITALGTVMLPRMSYVLSKSDADYRSIILSSMRLALTLSCAMAMGLIVIADDICPVFFGPGSRVRTRHKASGHHCHLLRLVERREDAVPHSEGKRLRVRWFDRWGGCGEPRLERHPDSALRVARGVRGNDSRRALHRHIPNHCDGE